MVLKILLASSIAGIVIGIASFLFIGTKWLHDVYLPQSYLDEAFKVISALAFSIGLLVICACKLDLFTGKVGFLFERQTDFTNRWSQTAYLLTIFIFNLVFATATGVGTYHLLNTTHYLDIINTIVTEKTNFTDVNSYFSLSLRSIFCGSCVHFAVKGFNYSFIFCILFVVTFVYNDFQHCIANAFFFGSLYRKVNLNTLIYEGITIVGNIIGAIPIAILFNCINKVKVESSSSLELNALHAPHNHHAFDYAEYSA